MDSRQQLRQQLRAQRRSLSSQEQARCADQLGKQLVRHPRFLASKRVAFYLPNDGEISPIPLMARALNMGKACYLPVLDGQRLRFGRYRPGDILGENPFGILEPQQTYTQLLRGRQLDLVLMPLVAFDRNGGRLGMGGGFYDRTFAFRLTSTSQRPHLVGLAHSFQCIEEGLDTQPWDVPLSAVATEREVISC